MELSPFLSTLFLKGTLNIEDNILNLIVLITIYYQFCSIPKGGLMM